MTAIRVPATSANLGPGFDALGLALGLYNRFVFEEATDLLIEGCPPELATEDNLFVLAYRRGLEARGRPYRGLHLRIEASIPIARGLGSSAACIVGGLVAAALVAGEVGAAGPEGAAVPGWKAGLVDLAAELEGHPDNVVPALLGGFCASLVEGGRVSFYRREIEDRLSFHALVPPFPLSTAVARAALPRELAFGDAVHSAGAAALVAAAFASARYELLAAAISDRLHEPYRAPLIPGFDRVRRAAREAGALAVYLSGAGPTIMALGLEEGRGRDFARAMETTLRTIEGGPWRLIELGPDGVGAYIEGGQDAKP
jgi:homoserine kinase